MNFSKSHFKISKVDTTSLEPTCVSHGLHKIEVRGRDLQCEVKTEAQGQGRLLQLSIETKETITSVKRRLNVAEKERCPTGSCSVTNLTAHQQILSLIHFWETVMHIVETIVWSSNNHLVRL